MDKSKLSELDADGLDKSLLSGAVNNKVQDTEETDSSIDIKST